MSKGDHIELLGRVISAEGGTIFRVKIDDMDTEVITRLAGKLRQQRIKILLGDRVRVKVSPYDVSNGLIVWRFTN